MRPLFLCAAILFSLVATLPASAAQWLLVAMPQTADKKGQILDLKSSFQVILTNATTHDLKVWKEDCPWGYSTLSFEFIGKDGKIVKVEKNLAVYWTRNAPHSFIVPPGCAYIVDVNLSESNGKSHLEWLGTEALHGAMTMRTIYTNTQTGLPGNATAKKDLFGHTTDNSAWVGQIKSALIKVNIVR